MFPIYPRLSSSLQVKWEAPPGTTANNKFKLSIQEQDFFIESNKKHLQKLQFNYFLRFKYFYFLYSLYNFLV